MPRFVERDVRSEDPELSPEANRLLTEELREILGADRVEVPVDVPLPATHPNATAFLAANRLLLVVIFLAGLVIGAIVSLATGSAWALVVALVLDACATAIIAFGAILLATEVEHVSPRARSASSARACATPTRSSPSSCSSTRAPAGPSGGCKRLRASGATRSTASRTA